MTAMLKARIDSVVSAGYEDLRDSISIPVVGKVRSAGGEPPRLDKSDLYNGIIKVETTNDGPTRVVAKIFVSPDQVEKACYLEKGTSKMEKRPFWGPWVARFRTMFSRSA